MTDTLQDLQDQIDAMQSTIQELQDRVAIHLNEYLEFVT